MFISYSHLDKQWLDLLKTHLKPLVKYKKLAVWDDKMIKSGEKWQDRIEGALASAKVAVLLVSPNFLASDFILEIELPTLLKAAESEGLYMLWIPVSASSYDTTDLQPYQAAQEPKEPLDMLPEGRRNQVMVEICKRIAEACDDGTSEKS